MPKPLKDIIAKSTNEPEGKGGYKARSPDEARFIGKHKVTKTPDANGNDDKLFNASNIKQANRFPRHGYEDGTDDKVYEAKNVITHAPGVRKGPQRLGKGWANNLNPPSLEDALKNEKSPAMRKAIQGFHDDAQAAKGRKERIAAAYYAKIAARKAAKEPVKEEEEIDEGLAQAMKSFKDHMADRKAKKLEASKPAVKTKPAGNVKNFIDYPHNDDHGK